jgi:drug/metabolite transporter (DMT)-like permease
VTSRYLPLLSFLAFVWGASYLFIKVAVDEIEPAPMMFARLAIAAVLLVLFLMWREGVRSALRQLRSAARAGLVLGFVNAAVPFTLIAWGEKHIDSGVAAIANATVPIFNALLVIKFLPSEKLSAGRLVGVLAGFVGVGVLAAGDPEGGWWAAAGTFAVVVASFSYAIGSIYGQRRVHGIPGPVLATASMIGGALVLLPVAAFQIPSDVPSLEASASVLTLAVAGTAIAQLVLFQMLRLHGSARAVLVTYLMPPIALFYGAVLLDEAITAAAVGGLALILGGVAIGSGAVRLPRRAPAVPQAP